ncbi:DUF3592 domain-containing protein [Zophobihabitans entericus]|uniref:DUF3592 domain-containing protein n=1 Tax=Zophobihabitans entericus TaxID=1635327 RepID=A0A6G9IDA3_9GAMM|nr:DUF3592 domain-containing protein [Zophobihabitans entericus]QIQ21684.1 DUF3592 domain-containing protein [Zophobihabitans entericus]
MIRTFFILIFGVISLCMSVIITSQKLSFIKSSVQVEGTVAYLSESYSDNSGSPSYYPVVTFQDGNGITRIFRSEVGSNPASYDRGEIVNVYYNPDDPTDAKINGFLALWFASIVTGILGIIFCLFPILTLKRFFTRKKEGGVFPTATKIPIQAIFDSVEVDTSSKIDGDDSYVIHCHWVDPIDNTKKYHFKSKNIPFNPEPYITQDRITVYVDRNDLKQYKVDIRFLPMYT